MTARSVNMGAPFRWLMKSLDVGRKNPRALFGGFALMMLVILVPSVIQMALELGLKPSMNGKLALLALAAVAGAVLAPPVLAGAIRLIHACETGQAANASDVLAVYRDGPTAVRMILLSLLLMLVYVALFGSLMMLPAGAYFRELFVISLSTPAGQQPDMSALPAIPSGMLLWVLAFGFAAMVITFAYMFAFMQAALGGRGPVGAATDGFLATFRNVLPFIGFSIVLMIVGFVAMLLVTVVLVLVVALASMLSPALGIAVMIPLYIGLMLLMYVVMFGFFYHGWRDIFGEIALPPATADAVAV